MLIFIVTKNSFDISCFCRRVVYRNGVNVNVFTCSITKNIPSKLASDRRQIRMIFSRRRPYIVTVTFGTCIIFSTFVSVKRDDNLTPRIFAAYIATKRTYINVIQKSALGYSDFII